MNILKILLLFCLILLVNKCLIKVDYSKIFKNNSSKEIYILNMCFSIIIGYLLYLSLLEIYNLTLILN